MKNMKKNLSLLVVYILALILVISTYFHEKNEFDGSVCVEVQKKNASSKDICGGKTIPSKGCAEIPRGFFNMESGGGSCSRGTQPCDDLPTSIDWREMGAVNDVMNQCDCESCWAFSAVTSVEGIVKITTGELLKLSQQQLIDCDRGNNGCNKGYVNKAFEYIVNHKGLALYDLYPYTASNGICRSAIMQHFGRISGYVRLPVGESFLQRAVSKQPVSVIVAPSPAFDEYVGGIFEGPCEVEYPLERYEWHALNVIGYATEDDGRKYWILKNSWGKNWGEGGFMRMRMNGGGGGPWGLCAIAMYGFYPTV